MMDSKTYTVGWICAIETEYIAAQCFLDEKHGKPESLHANDSNHYTLGKIAGHDVVIAVLPDGEYGISSATAVVKDMLHSFPNVRIGLMVGVGGGAPSSKHDIRLGDIVVSAPRGGNSGVFQYDFGKTIQDQSFQTTGVLNQPPAILRTALAGLGARYRSEGHELEATINNILSKKKRLRRGFQRPDPSTDRLYKSEIVHSRMNEDCITLCGDDPSKLVSRTERTEDDDNPAVHRGLIASANQLMKDAVIRDRLADEKDVLCFEMEAAGLMNQFPCLVIRGICDYSDSHKNKKWQGYAAMAAAAYAKDLLCEIVPAKVQAVEKIADIPGILSSIENNIYEMQADVKIIQNKTRSTDIDRWLAAPNASTNYNKALQQRHEGSGDWLIESKQFIEWKTSAMRDSFLWLHGIPGCGKTILSSAIIQALEGNPSNAEAQPRPACQPLIYFYFDFIDVSKQTLENMLRSLILQLSHKHEGASVHLESLYSSCSDGRQPTTRLLCDTFVLMLAEAEEVWIVLDALDECRTRTCPATGLLTWMSDVLASQKTIVHLLATSRPETDIQSQIMSFARPQDVIPIQNSLISDDIKAYIFSRVRGDRGLKRWRSLPEVQNEIETCLMEKANGMFRWVACQLDALENCLEYRSLRKSLISLPKTLDDTYARILRNIPEEHKESTIRILQFLTYSKRPLTIEEAIDVIVVDTDSDEHFNPKYRMPDSDEILRYCSSLVIAAPTDQSHGPSSSLHRQGTKTSLPTQLQLAHFSVKEYLTSNRLDSDIAQNFQDTIAKETIASVCLAYLLHLNYSRKTPLQTIRFNYPFAQYCARYWIKFARVSEGDNEELRGLIQKFFDTSQDAFEKCYDLYPLDRPWGADTSLNDTDHVTPIYYASFGGLLFAVKDLISKGHSIDGGGQDYGNALQAAAAGGHEEIVEFLLNQGADVNAQDASHYGNALNAASIEGHFNIVKSLLKQGADVSAQCGDCDCALRAASLGGHVEIVKLLLDHGADPNVEDESEFGSILAVASLEGNENIVRILLHYGANVNAQDKGFGNALQAAIARNQIHIVQLLLSKGANANAKGDDHNGSALQFASVRGRLQIVEILLSHGADVHMQGGRQFSNALQAATAMGHQKVVETLLRHVHAADTDTNTPHEHQNRISELS
ncbi:hypothetical protein TWF706_009196 [Orbilia oligospora]|nr:hypothetical protein TWF706_009196 [Orbilia oligospora]